MLVISYTGMALFLAIVALAGNSLLILAAMILYVVSFALGSGAIPALYVNEIGGDVRGQASSVAFSTHWVMNIMIGQTFLPLANKFGVGAMYVVFAASCCLAAVFVSMVCIETKGKALDQIIL